MALNKSKSRGRLSTKRPIQLAVVLLGMAGFWRAGRLFAQALAGGTLAMPFPFFAAGGTGQSKTGGSLSLVATIGQMGNTSMAGGTLQLVPGNIGAQAVAMGNLDTVHAFPVPFKPGLGHDRITFRGLTTNATVRVYTVAGELVQTLSKNDATTSDLVWYPVVNSAGETAASGVYLYVVEDQTQHQKATGKLMVVR